MRATSLEYRLRFALYALILVLGFWPFWEPWLGLTTKSTWLTLSAALARAGWLGFQAATILLLVVGLVFAVLGAWFRVWGSAFVGENIVQSPSTHGEILLAGGPFRRTRNPLSLGTLLHTIGIALLMPPAGAVFAVAAIWILQVRLSLAEDLSLASRFGHPYQGYMENVPRFLPAPRPQAPSTGLPGRWIQACLGEIYFLGVVVTMLIFGWNFNATPLFQGILISLGAGIVIQALLPRAPHNSEPVEI